MIHPIGELKKRYGDKAKIAFKIDDKEDFIKIDSLLSPMGVSWTSGNPIGSFCPSTERSFYIFLYLDDNYIAYSYEITNKAGHIPYDWKAGKNEFEIEE